MTDAQKPASPLVATIADTLHEPNVKLVRRVVKVLGEARAQAVLEETLTIEAAGGLLTADQSRRRTPGGVFFHVVKSTTPRKLRLRIFPPPEMGAQAKPRHDLRCMGVQFSRPCLAYISSTSHQAVQGQDDACED